MIWKKAFEDTPNGLPVLVARKLNEYSRPVFNYFIAIQRKGEIWELILHEADKTLTRIETKIQDVDSWCQIIEWLRYNPEYQEHKWIDSSVELPKISNYYLVYIAQGLNLSANYKVIFFNHATSHWDLEEYSNLTVEWWHQIDLLSCKYRKKHTLS